MMDKNKDKLNNIKNAISDGSYSILQPQQWDTYSGDLANCGANLLKEIERLRNDIRELRVIFPFIKCKKSLSKANNDYGVLAQDFDLFYDSSMKFLRSIINNNQYE